jgi:hypothetical protein
MPHTYKTEAELFSDSYSTWQAYICYKVFCKVNKVKPPPPEVWICGKMLQAIDKGLDATDRKDVEEMLDELGWYSYTNANGQLCLRPRVG